jgi:hypothetical protein
LPIASREHHGAPHRNDGNHEIVVVSPRLYLGANWPDGIKELLESAIPYLARKMVDARVIKTSD